MNFLTKRRPRRATEIYAILVVLTLLVVAFAAIRGCA